jgi:hypothetical protein
MRTRPAILSACVAERVPRVRRERVTMSSVNSQAHHVGIVTGPYRMLHAPRTGSSIIEEHLSQERSTARVRAGRVPMLPSLATSAG